MQPGATVKVFELTQILPLSCLLGCLTLNELFKKIKSNHRASIRNNCTGKTHNQKRRYFNRGPASVLCKMQCISVFGQIIWTHTSYQILKDPKRERSLTLKLKKTDIVYLGNSQSPKRLNWISSEVLSTLKVFYKSLRLCGVCWCRTEHQRDRGELANTEREVRDRRTFTISSYICVTELQPLGVVCCVLPFRYNLNFVKGLSKT